MPFNKKDEDEPAVKVKKSDGGKKPAAPTPKSVGDGGEPSRPRRPRMSSAVDGETAEPTPKERGKRTAKSAAGGKLGQNKIVIGAVALLAAAVLVWAATRGRGSEPPADTAGDSTPPVVSTQPTPTLSPNQEFERQLASEGYGVGADGGGSGLGLVESDVMLKDLDGQDMPELFEVKAIAWVSDFVTFTKHRALTGDGIELYWLDGMYNGQPCRVVVPYTYYADLPETGAVVCNIEIVQTTDGNKIATYFQFDKAAYDRLQKK